MPTQSNQKMQLYIDFATVSNILLMRMLVALTF